ncbi:transcriptional adapter ADA2 isoform X1 [Amborella trichopoda]|uniref:transcriptional adapter ADA2 isoform X1 n=1 Tax=Amborella trichopoda TaxID=13333 RepID=UPI0005D2F1F1|nr:transcriptional adapter ADA2 isoform X1 [Amborella trichopoda]|eukprot:XP_011625124.1 transcriptional adapter ADA2 isoform X1 [Amborella trichopoda]
MGRSRAAVNAGEDDPNQRSKRRRVASSGENIEAGPTGTTEGKRALYHCNYCNKDISGKIRIKCTKCPDFDLCVECFSVGAEVTPHKSNHPYRVMDNLSFPLICSDWNADEEILLLEGIEMYGLGNWAEVAEHVGTKSKAQCIDHHTIAYINSPCYPLPDMSRVNGKNRKELLAMAKVQTEGKKGFSAPGEILPKEESPFSPTRLKVEEAPTGRSPSNLTADGEFSESKINGVGRNSVIGASAGAGKKASNMLQLKDGSDGIKIENLASVEDSHMDRSLGGKKPKVIGDKGPSMTELSGYNPKRQEFDPEYDNDAEQPLAEMEFKDNDTETDRELKLRVLRIYLSRLDERKRRKDFILERNLLYPNPLEKELSKEDTEIYHRCKVFMRFHSQEEHDALIRGFIQERKIRQRIQELQEYRAVGCHTLAEGERYAAEKRRKESESNIKKAKEGGHLGASGKVLQKVNRPMMKEKPESDGSPGSTVDNQKTKGPMAMDSCVNNLSSTRAMDQWDITGLPGANLLSSSEQQLCCQNRLLPAHYLKMKEVLTLEALKGTTVEKSDAYRFFKVDPSKVDKVYDLVTKINCVKGEEFNQCVKVEP